MYNGWLNYETWNVNMWIGGDEGFYRCSLNCSSYPQFVELMHSVGCYETPDGVRWDDSEIDSDELTELTFEGRD